MRSVFPPLSLSEPVANTEVAVCDFYGTECHRASARLSCDFCITNTAAMLGGSQEAEGQAACGAPAVAPAEVTADSQHQLSDT